jgi:hypothetical protein
MSTNAAPSFEAVASAAEDTEKKSSTEEAANDAEGDAGGDGGKTEEKADVSAKIAEEDLGDPIPEPAQQDVLSGRGASVNNHPGNKRFRALCFVRKPLFDAGNHAAKRRIATEIVDIMMTPKDGSSEGARFLKRKNDKSPYYAMTREQAISKSQQVMRDYRRPDRIALRENLEASGQLRKRNRTTVSTPIDEVCKDGLHL